MNEGYTPELLEFLKKHNPNRTEEKIIQMIQNTRIKAANAANVSVNTIVVDIDKCLKTITIRHKS